MRKKTINLRTRILGAIAMAIMAIVLVGITPIVANVVAQSTSTPLEYYKTIEKSNSDKQIDKFTKSYGDYISNYKNLSTKGVGVEVSMKATIDKSIATQLGLKGLKSIKANVVSMQTGQKFKSSVSLFANDTKFTSLDFLLDNKKGLAYILIPELNKAYLKMSTNTDYGELLGAKTSFDSNELLALIYDNSLTEELLNKLLKKYSDLIISEINNVDETKQENITAGKVTQDTTKITVKLDEKTLLAVAQKVLIAAKEDKELMDLCVEFKVCTKKEYTKSIQEQLDTIKKDQTIATTKEALNMNIWVDKKGNIIGREFAITVDKEETSFGYKVAKSGSDLGIEAWMKEDKDTDVKVVGNFIISTKGLTGSAKLTVKEKDEKTSETVTLKLEDVKYTGNKSSSYINGKITMTGTSMPGISIVSSCTGSKDKQNIVMKFVQDKVNVVTLSIDSKQKDYKEFSLPSKSAKIYSFEKQFEKYLAASDMNKYIKSINKKIKINSINEILNELLTTN